MIEIDPDRRIRDRPDRERDELADEIARQLDRPMAAIGIVFLLLVLAETLIEPRGALGVAFQVASWLIVAAFTAEFALRLYVAPSRGAFLRRNWHQLIFLVLPFLRVFRVLRGLRALRLGRAGRILSSALRVTRTAGRRLRGRIAWLATVTTIVVLAASQVLYELGDVDTYSEALYRAAMATITGEPTTIGGIGRVLDVVLAGYSVVVFAALAGFVGAFLIERRRDESLVAATPDEVAPAGR
jgi:voltage-gated potassium channel